MSYNIEISSRFEKKMKKLIKKFPSFLSEITALRSALKLDPFQGDPLGHDCYKIRLGIESKGRGKSGRARIITNVYVAHNIVYMLDIYDKSEQEDISDKDLLSLVKAIR